MKTNRQCIYLFILDCQKWQKSNFLKITNIIKKTWNNFLITNWNKFITKEHKIMLKMNKTNSLINRIKSQVLKIKLTKIKEKLIKVN